MALPLYLTSLLQKKIISKAALSITEFSRSQVRAGSLRVLSYHHPPSELHWRVISCREVIGKIWHKLCVYTCTWEKQLSLNTIRHTAICQTEITGVSSDCYKQHRACGGVPGLARCWAALECSSKGVEPKMRGGWKFGD